jgi:hypothetical protein
LRERERERERERDREPVMINGGSLLGKWRERKRKRIQLNPNKQL